jgi:hypothetical protein
MRQGLQLDKIPKILPARCVMRGTIIRIYGKTLAVLLLSLSIAGPATARKKAMDVLDYYCALPDEYFQCELSSPVSKEARIKQIVKKNVKNGYISAKSEGFPMQVALFTDSHLKLDIIAVNIACGEGCMCNKFALLSHSEGGKWTEVTADIFPRNDELIKAVKAKTGRDDVSFEYVLPEFGTAIKVVDSSSKKQLVEIQWSGGQFFIK